MTKIQFIAIISGTIYRPTKVVIMQALSRHQQPICMGCCGNDVGISNYAATLMTEPSFFHVVRHLC